MRASTSQKCSTTIKVRQLSNTHSSPQGCPTGSLSNYQVVDSSHYDTNITTRLVKSHFR
ncbi:hypothetical protein SCLCIDRAFT_1219125 [Scleroderma citrinum Foug A]|uniref:Uncharacterized protein n=1 Tax=Scleroderma citrinum Foug A TaxID=1036808 RepID=A0A0C2Z782_9AGAM|nr:hypothetical protein SCLCIDRAFT_1219125 [Scleroderma citrinum Foug A]